MNYVTVDDLDFMELVKNKFENNPRLETYRDDEYQKIALRIGENRDSILIFHYLYESPLFMGVLKKCPKLILEGENNECGKTSGN